MNDAAQVNQPSYRQSNRYRLGLLLIIVVNLVIPVLLLNNSMALKTGLLIIFYGVITVMAGSFCINTAKKKAFLDYSIPLPHTPYKKSNGYRIGLPLVMIGNLLPLLLNHITESNTGLMVTFYAALIVIIGGSLLEAAVKKAYFIATAQEGQEWLKNKFYHFGLILIIAANTATPALLNHTTNFTTGQLIIFYALQIVLIGSRLVESCPKHQTLNTKH